jgi:phosphatidylglycerophosphatase A
MRSFKLSLGTLFGAGLLPKAPGTWGSFFTLPLIYLAFWLAPQYGILLLLIGTSLLSLWTADPAVEKYGEDPAQFVMDEVAGQSLVFISTPFLFNSGYDLLLLLTGFLLFRFFDIKKPLGINKIQKLHGKFGILADDLLAGLYSLLLLEIISIWIFPLLF